jgi:hypothetical protein
MPLITNSNEKAVIHAIAKIDIFDSLNLDIYKHPIQILSPPETMHLIKIQKLFKNFELYIDRIYEKKITVDTQSFVYEGAKSAYHYFANCKALNSDYIDYSIPVEIKAKGDKEVERYRAWFKNNAGLIESNPSLFSTRLQATFFIKNPKSIERIAKENSGFTILDNLNLQNIEEEIASIIQEAEEYQKSDNKITEIIHNFGHLTHKKYTNKKVHSVTNIWHKYKSNLKEKLFTYYKIKFNPNLELHGKLLTALGFVECSLCSRNQYS